MKYEPLPPSKIADPSFAHLSVHERIAVWADLVDSGIDLVLAGLRRRTNSEEELRAAFGEWLETHRAEHDQSVQKMMQKFRER